LDVDDEQDVIANQPNPGESFHTEEVRRRQNTKVRVQKSTPRHSSAAHCRGLDSVILENTLDSIDFGCGVRSAARFAISATSSRETLP
jgi:hypothetical protein